MEPFHLCVGHLYTFFGEVSIQVLHQFFKLDCLCFLFPSLSRWQGGKRTCLWVTEDAGWAGSETRSRNQAGPRGPAGCKMQFDQSAVSSCTSYFNYWSAQKFKVKWPQQSLQQHPCCSHSLYEMFWICPFRSSYNLWAKGVGLWLIEVGAR